MIERETESERGKEKEAKEKERETLRVNKITRFQGKILC